MLYTLWAPRAVGHLPAADAGVPGPWLEHCDCVSHYVHRAQWATFPLLQLVFQAGDTAALLRRRTHGASLYGAGAADFALAAAGKAAHFALLAGLPWALHGAGAAAAGVAAYMATQVCVWAVRLMSGLKYWVKDLNWNWTLRAARCGMHAVLAAAASAWPAGRPRRMLSAPALSLWGAKFD